MQKGPLLVFALTEVIALKRSFPLWQLLLWLSTYLPMLQGKSDQGLTNPHSQKCHSGSSCSQIPQNWRRVELFYQLYEIYQWMTEDKVHLLAPPGNTTCKRITIFNPLWAISTLTRLRVFVRVSKLASTSAEETLPSPLNLLATKNKTGGITTQPSANSVAGFGR